MEEKKWPQIKATSLSNSRREREYGEYEQIYPSYLPYVPYVPYVSKFLDIIPRVIKPKYLQYLQSQKYFTRDRKLPFPKIITFTLSMTTSGKSKGVNGKIGEFFKNARRSGLWLDAPTIHPSAVTKGRKKVPWQIFEEISYDAVQLAYELWPDEPIYGYPWTWEELSVYAFDGSKYLLPATEEIRQEFDPTSGLRNNWKGHYPQCLVITAYDVFRRLPVARTVAPNDSSEREEAKKLVPKIPENNLLLFDRGYPGFEFIKYVKGNYNGYYIFRSPATSTFPEVATFIRSGKKQDVIELSPTQKYLKKFPSYMCKSMSMESIKIRVIRLKSPDGVLSVLLTNLFDEEKFTRKKIIQLYFKRWEVESYYRDEKVYLDVIKFHCKNANGIYQELFASVIMSVIARTLMVLSSKEIEIEIGIGIGIETTNSLKSNTNSQLSILAPPQKQKKKQNQKQKKKKKL